MDTAAQNMDERKTTIDDLSRDNLKEIMMQVAVTPTGTAEIQNSFIVCKAFHQLSNDEDILKTVVFENLTTYCLYLCESSSLRRWDRRGPDLSSQFEAFQQIGGYVYRAAKAGNLGAQIMLAKLIIRSASEVLRGTSEASSSRLTRRRRGDGDGAEKASRLAKASSFLAHFMPQATDDITSKTLVHYELVKKLLVHANLEELQRMKPYLQDYVSYFSHPETIGNSSKFCVSLDEWDELNNTRFLRFSAHSYARSFNDLCVAGQEIMQGLGKDLSILQSLKMPKVNEIDYLKPTEVLEQFVTVEGILRNVMHEILGPDYEQDHYAYQHELPMARLVRWMQVVKGGLVTYLHHVQSIVNRQQDIVSEFDAIFSIKCSNS